MNFNIHNLIKLKVEGTNKRYLRYLSHDYSYFRTYEPVDSDIDIFLSDFTPDTDDCYVVDRKYWIKQDFLFCTHRHKVVRWKTRVTGLTQKKTTVYFSGSRFGELFLRDYIIEPLIGFKLATRGFSMLHASAISIGDAGFVFVGGPKAGKTAAILSLDVNNNAFLSDEITLLSNDGVIYSFPSPIRVYHYNLGGISHHHKMAFRQNLEVRLKHYIYILSLGYAKLPLCINAEKLFERVGGAYPLRCLILLTTTRGDNVQVTEIADKKELINRLVTITQQQFHYWFKYVSAYSSLYPSSQVASYSQTIVDNLAKALSKVACYKITIPHNFSKSHRDKFQQAIKTLREHLTD